MVSMARTGKGTGLVARERLVNGSSSLSISVKEFQYENKCGTGEKRRDNSLWNDFLVVFFLSRIFVIGHDHGQSSEGTQQCELHGSVYIRECSLQDFRGKTETDQERDESFHLPV